MHYYLEAFKKILMEIPNVSVSILSNYTDSNRGKPFFLNHYKGNKIKKGLSLIANIIKLKRFVANHPNDIYIYLTYGNSIDIPFINIVSNAKQHVVDIHEAIAQDVDSNEKLKSKFKALYKNKVNAVISHSNRTDIFLKEYEFNGQCFNVPHFKYVYQKEFDIKKIPDEVIDAPDKDKINILFFGNLNESKGVDLLIESINLLDSESAKKINVIIAGKDFDGSIDRIKPFPDRNITIIKRHITDDELRFLYSKTDYIALPYRKTSQSGILETAFYFKKPVIASNVEYFEKTIKEFPSFGILAGMTPTSYADALSKVIKSENSNQYFLDSDYARYENRKEVADFKSEFENWVNNFHDK